MKILILGSGSFAGQILFSNFLSKGYEVYGINRSAPKNAAYWEWINKIDKPLKLENLEDVKSFSKKFKTIVKEKYNLSFLDKKIPTLYNSYKRIYFENIIDNIRLTIDVDLKYFSPITKISYKEKYIIIEIKYNSDIKFINNFNNISFTRYSKYVKGTSQTTFSNTIY